MELCTLGDLSRCKADGKVEANALKKLKIKCINKTLIYAL